MPAPELAAAAAVVRDLCLPHERSVLGVHHHELHLRRRALGSAIALARVRVALLRLGRRRLALPLAVIVRWRRNAGPWPCARPPPIHRRRRFPITSVARAGGRRPDDGRGVRVRRRATVPMPVPRGARGLRSPHSRARRLWRCQCGHAQAALRARRTKGSPGGGKRAQLLPHQSLAAPWVKHGIRRPVGPVGVCRREGMVQRGPQEGRGGPHTKSEAWWCQRPPRVSRAAWGRQRTPSAPKCCTIMLWRDWLSRRARRGQGWGLTSPPLPRFRSWWRRPALLPLLLHATTHARIENLHPHAYITTGTARVVRARVAGAAFKPSR